LSTPEDHEEKLPVIGPTGYDRGWMCPKCGAVYAPWVAECSYCKPQFVYRFEYHFPQPYAGDLELYPNYSIICG
jgi:hypothetical protein